MNPIVKFVAKQLFGQKGAIANRKAVDFSVAKLVERLTNFGVDPRSIKDEKQLIQILNSVKKMEDQAFEQQFGDMLKKSKIKKSAEVVDLQGKKIPNPEKNIMGGQAFETEEEIAERIAKQNKESIERLKEKRLKEKLDDADNLDPEEKADGGRIGFKKGMDRRTFMKMVGGLTALPILGKFFKGAEVAAPVAEKAVEAAKSAPPYFFNLVDRIKALGTKYAGPKERSEFYRYKDYEMDVDYDTGVIEIKKTKEAMIPGGDEAGVSEEVYMTYKPGRGDEATKGTPADEYEEFTAKPDIDGKMKDVEEGVPDEVIEEGSIGKEQLEQEIVEQIARDKKASGGIAMMLGE